MPAGNRAALPVRQCTRLNAKLCGGILAPGLALLGTLQPALGVLAGLNAVLPPAGQQVGHGGDGAPPQTGDLGAAEQNDIWLPAVV